LIILGSVFVLFFVNSMVPLWGRGMRTMRS
jgi:hypothetical protein